MKKVIVDGDGAVLGRLGSFVAKELLKGSSVDVINSEKVVITGDKKVIMKKIVDIRSKGGASQKGPKMTKLPDKMLKRKIRGMLPWDRQKGRDAYKRLKCYVGNELKEEELKDVKKINSKVSGKFMTLADVENLL